MSPCPASKAKLHSPTIVLFSVYRRRFTQLSSRAWLILIKFIKCRVFFLYFIWLLYPNIVLRSVLRFDVELFYFDQKFFLIDRKITMFCVIMLEISRLYSTEKKNKLRFSLSKHWLVVDWDYYSNQLLRRVETEIKGRGNIFFFVGFQYRFSMV